MSPETPTADAPTEQPPASMETLMTQLGAAKSNTTIVGSASAVHEEIATAAGETSP